MSNSLGGVQGSWHNVTRFDRKKWASHNRAVVLGSAGRAQPRCGAVSHHTTGKVSSLSQMPTDHNII